MDWEMFRQSLNNKINLKISLKSPNDLDKAANYLTISIQEAAWSSSFPIPPKTSQTNLPLYVRSLIIEKRRARTIWQIMRYPSHKRQYNNLANKLKRLLATIRSEKFAQHLSALSSIDKSLWKNTRKILCSQPPVPPLRKSDGSWAIKDSGKANIYSQHLSQTFQLHYDTLTPNKIQEIENSLILPIPLTLPSKHIRPSEVQHLIGKSARHKTSGYDLITIEVAS